jgi:hypothetical protein
LIRDDRFQRKREAKLLDAAKLNAYQTKNEIRRDSVNNNNDFQCFTSSKFKNEEENNLDPLEYSTRDSLHDSDNSDSDGDSHGKSIENDDEIKSEENTFNLQQGLIVILLSYLILSFNSFCFTN